MTELHATMQRGETAIAGWLIEHRIALHGLGEGFGVALLLHLESVEAGAEHEHELVAQHLSRGAQLAAIVEALAQEARLAVGAAVAESRKDEPDRGDPIEMGHEVVDVAAVRPDHAELARTAQERLRILQEACGRHQD